MNNQSPKQQRSWRFGWADSGHGGLLGISTTALDLALNTNLTDGNSAFSLESLSIAKQGQGRITVRQNDGTVTRDLIVTNRDLNLDRLGCIAHVFTSLEVIGDTGTTAGDRAAGSIGVGGYEILKSGFSPKILSGPAVTVGNPAGISFPLPHGLKTGEKIRVAGNTSTPSLDGMQTVTVMDSHNVTVPVNVTVAVSDGVFAIDPTVGSQRDLVAQAATAGTISSTVYEVLHVVDQGEVVQLDWVHLIGATGQDASIVLASDAAGANQVEVARSCGATADADTATFEKRLITVTSKSVSGDSTFILLKSTSGGTANACHALVLGKKFFRACPPEETNFVEATVTGGGAAAVTTSVRMIAQSSRYLIERIAISPGTADTVIVGTAEDAAGTNFIPIAISDNGQPLSWTGEHQVYDTARDLYIVAKTFKAGAGDDVAGVAVDGHGRFNV